jgi:hypothetical protein
MAWKIVEKLSSIKNINLGKLPDRTKIFLSALWLWTYVLYYFTKIINIILRLIVTYTPDSCIIFNNKLIKPNEHAPIIIDAKIHDKSADNMENITNKFSILINNIWDEDIGDKGGIRIKDIVNKFTNTTSPLMWVSYLFEMDKKLENMTDEEISESIKHMLVNISDKIIERDPESKESEESEEISFGEIPFD